MLRDDFYKPTDADALRMENELLAFEARFLKAQLAESERSIARLEHSERDKESEVSRLQLQLADNTRRLEDLWRLGEEDREGRRRLEEERRRLEEERRRLEEANQRLVRWVEVLDAGISALLDSRQWKSGRALGELRRRVMLKPRVPTAQDHLSQVLQEFRDWKESRKRTRVGAEDDEEKSRWKADPTDRQSEHTVGLATDEKPSTSSPTVGLSETKGPERGWRFRNRSQGQKTKTKVSVISWDMTHNPVGRAHLIADALSRKFDVEIVGARFAKYGTEIWEPLRDGKIPTIDFVGQNFPAHFAEMEELAEHIDGDVVFVSKPRLPSYELGILAKRFRNRPLILDVDDHELSFFGEDEGLVLDEVKALQKDREFLNPYGKLWTQYCESIIPYADHLTVSNAELQKKYGGTIFPHVKDERKFDPALYDRDSIRAKFGFTPEDKVILFIGTPRLHKGIVEIAEALEKIGNPRYKLCVIGTVVDHDLRIRLERLKGDHVRLFENQPYSDLPANLSIGDLVCLLQDRESGIARYQMPSKFTDALAMEIPILATDVPPLANLASSGLVELLGDAPLDRKIDEIFSNHTSFKRKAVENRKVFLEEYSYAAAAERIEGAVLPLLGETPPVPGEFERLLQFHREVFSPPSDSALGGRVAEKPQRGIPSRELEPQNPISGRQAVGTEKNSGYVDDKYDIVFFWKQNDTGIYGRRQDMIVKYLSESPKVNRIVHFDAPIGATALHSLLDLSEEGKISQGNLVFSQTVSRLLGLEHSEKVKCYTFVYAEQGSPVGLMASRPLPKRGDYLRYLNDVLRENGVGRRRTIFWVCPVNFDFPSIALALGPDLIVADVVDDNRDWNAPGSDQFKERSRNYKEILGMSELVMVNCQPVKRSMLAYAEEIHVVPNAAELPDASEARQARPEELKRMKGPVLGYVGNLSSRIDIDLLEHVATARPEWNIVLIGSAHLSKDILRLDAFDNVHFLGVKGYPEVRRYIGNFDVAIIPHVDNQMSRAMNPLKLFVYASMNVPTVSTEIQNLDELRELVHVALNKEDFVRKVEAALREGKPVPSNERTRLLKQNSWDERVNRILELIDEKVPTNV